MFRQIVGIGETVLDIIFKNDEPQTAMPGGSTFNAMISLGRTVPKIDESVRMLMATEVGDDHISYMITSFLEKNGIDISAVTRNKDSKSNLSLAFLDENNDAHYDFYKDHAGARLQEDKVSSLSFSENDIVLFGSYFAINPALRVQTRSMLNGARKNGATLYYDVNFRANHIKDIPIVLDNIEENFALSDFVRGSDEDFRSLFGTDDGYEIFSRVSNYCPNLIITRGACPVEVFASDEHYSFPVPQIETVSTIGAGDNFNAGFIYALIKLGLTRNDVLDKELWRCLIDSATRFSSAACQSIYNYV